MGDVSDQAEQLSEIMQSEAARGYGEGGESAVRGGQSAETAGDDQSERRASSPASAASAANVH